MAYRAIPAGSGLFATTDDGTDYLASLFNPRNTAGADAIIEAKVGGTSAGDAVFQAEISGGALWSWGLDNSDSDNFVLSSGSALGTSNALIVSTTGSVGTTIQEITGQGKLRMDSSTGTRLSYTADEYVNIDSVAVTIAAAGIVRARVNTAGLASMPEASLVGGTIKTFQADASHDGTGTDVFYTHSIAAASMAVDGDRVDFDYTLTFAANANNKTVIVAYGATTVYSSGAVAKNGGSLRVWGSVIRTGAATQRFTVSAMDDASTTRFPVVTAYGTAAETLSGAVALELRGTATVAADIVAKFGTVEFKKGL